MSDHDTRPPETDDEIRARLRAFAHQVKERTDTEAALQRMPQRSRPPTIRLLAIAACLIAVVAVAAVVMAERESVDTIAPSQTPTTESSTTTTEAGGPTILARGQAEYMVGFAETLDRHTLNIDAVEQDGEVTGEFQVDNVVVTLQCAGTRRRTGGTSVSRDLILGGVVTVDPDGQGLPVHDGLKVAVGDRLALIIRKGPATATDRVTLWATDSGGSCTELVASVPLNLDGGYFSDIGDDGDIQTG
jgi:hypothetical protein